MNSTTRRLLSVAMSTAFLASTAYAQQFVYPAKGQSPDQQKKDEAECAKWATGQTGYDPSNPPPQAAAKPGTTATGTQAGAGVRGAARGAIVGGIAGDAGAGAAAGAVAARGQSRRDNAAQAQQQQQAQSSQQVAFGKARAACLEGRGYTIK